jgi:hypothetical protein
MWQLCRLPNNLVHMPEHLRDELFAGQDKPVASGVRESIALVHHRIMLKTIAVVLCSLLAVFTMPATANARLQCVAYARQVSEVQLSGNARDWRGNAAGTYHRGQLPVIGAVLAFRANRTMPMGHVAVVSKVLDARHLLINHANWSRPGMVERGAMVMDVSAAGDWSEVRVWYARTNSLGLRPSPTFGFIYPAHEMVAAENTLQNQIAG